MVAMQPSHIDKESETDCLKIFIAISGRQICFETHNNQQLTSKQKPVLIKAVSDKLGVHDGIKAHSRSP